MYLSYENTRDEIEAAAPDTAIIPLGSVEQHSSHLPIGTDCWNAEAVARGVAEQIGGLLLPVLPISNCYEHRCTGRFGGIWIRPTTYHQMLTDIILALREQGFRRVILILGHGGIFSAGPLTRELNAMYSDLLVIRVDPIRTAETEKICENKDGDIHAGERETSLMLHMHEELVDKEKMMQDDCIPDCPRDFLNYASLQKLSTTGAWGRSSLATKEKGEKILSEWIRGAVEYIRHATELGTQEKW